MASFIEQMATIQKERRLVDTAERDVTGIYFPLNGWEPVEWTYDKMALTSPFVPVVAIAARKRKLEFEYRDYSLLNIEQWVFVVVANDGDTQHLLIKEQAYNRDDIVEILEEFVSLNPSHMGTRADHSF